MCYTDVAIIMVRNAASPISQALLVETFCMEICIEKLSCFIFVPVCMGLYASVRLNV